VLDGEAGRTELRRLGARSLPVVSRGDKFVFAQVIRDVVEFLGLADDTAPQLSAAELASRYAGILETALRLTRQMPDAKLANQLPNRPRSWRVLLHHVFQIPDAFLDFEEGHGPYTAEKLLAEPPADMQKVAEIAAFGEAVHRRFVAWSERHGSEDFSVQVQTYFGPTTRHELFERTVWHSAQHVRQVASLLEQAGIAPDRPLSADQIRGLPLTEKIWDAA
jgi:DinB family